jgi:ABC-type phosphate transport system permease subunit
LAIALFLSEPPKPDPLRQVIRYVVQLLASLPSVLYGTLRMFVHLSLHS